MTKAAAAMDGPNRFPPPAMGWLAANGRILAEAADPAVPLAERLKFLAIFNGNLDEFYSVRITELRRAARSTSAWYDGSGIPPARQLTLFQRRMARIIARQDALWHQKLLPALAAAGVTLLSVEEAAEKTYQDFFDARIRPFLRLPVPAPEGCFTGVGGIGELALAVSFAGPEVQKERCVVVELPPELPRWYVFPEPGGATRIGALEVLLEAALPRLYQDECITAVQPFRILRDNDYHFEAVSPDVLPHTIRQKLRTRGERETVRLDLAVRPAASRLEKVLKSLPIASECRFRFQLPLRARDLGSLLPAAMRREPLADRPWPPVLPEWFDPARPMWETVTRHRELLLAPPYHRFEPLLQLLRTAAADPQVTGIYQTLYRVAAHSQVLDELCRAARNGKRVTVLLELKARFDEEKNVFWAERLREAGAKVLFGIPKLKVHAKLLLIERRTPDGGTAGVLHLSTGNYNEDTARIYADYGLFTADAALVRDARALFDFFLRGDPETEPSFLRLTAAPFGLREKVLSLIDREIGHVRRGRAGGLTARLNNLTDPAVIAKLHEAAASGVTLKLAVRGISCYVPSPGERTLIVRVIDRYLEHGRAFRFTNDGDEEVYLSSADWMPRNFDRRIELFFPVTGIVAGRIKHLLELPFGDSVKGSFLSPGGRWKKGAFPGVSSQEAAYRFWCGTARSAAALAISLYRAGDEVEISALAAAVGGEITAGYTPEGVRLYCFNAAPATIRERQRQHGALTLIARLDGVTAGVLEITEFSHLNMLFTAPELRGRGVASQLLNRALALLKRLPQQERPANLTVYAALNAVPAYRKLGFAPSGKVVKEEVCYQPMMRVLKEG